MMTVVTKSKIAPPTSSNAIVDELDKPHIVIIEDDQFSIDALQLVFKSHFSFISFTTANEALAYIRKHWQIIDLIVLDHMLPDMNGLSLLSIIKQDAYPKHLPTILQTASSKDALDNATVKPDLYLAKPYTRYQMLNAISTVIGRTIDKDYVQQQSQNLDCSAKNKIFSCNSSNWWEVQQCL